MKLAYPIYQNGKLKDIKDMRAKYVVGKCNDKNQPPFCNVCSRGKHYVLVNNRLFNFL